jgi:hypothetical protein
VNLGFEFSKTAAKPKRGSDDAPTREPMRAASTSGIRRKPSTDQKKVRRAMTKRAAVESPKESTMSREAQLLQAMAKADLPEQRRLALELDRLRRQASTRVQADRDLDLADTVIRDTLTPVRVHEHHTASTDWLDEVPTSPGEYDHAMRTEATVWFDRVHEAVKADREEFAEQAQGMARRVAGRFGEQAPAAAEAFLATVARLHRQAADQSGNAESTVTDYDSKTDQEPWLAEDWDGEAEGVHPPMPGAGEGPQAIDTPTARRRASRRQAASYTVTFDVPGGEEQSYTVTADDEDDAELEALQRAQDDGEEDTEDWEVTSITKSSRRRVAESDYKQCASCGGNIHANAGNCAHCGAKQRQKAWHESRRRTAGGDTYKVTYYIDVQGGGEKKTLEFATFEDASAVAQGLAQTGAYTINIEHPGQHLSRRRVANPQSISNTLGSRRLLTLPWSEVNMHMGIAGKVMEGEDVGNHMVQLYEVGSPTPFSFPITANEAGWGMVGADHTVTDFDQEGRWYPKASSRRRTAGEVPEAFKEQQKGDGDDDGGGQTCSVCGDAIERDDSDEDPQTWHHDNGEKHDHEAKPKGDSKESRRRTASEIEEFTVEVFRNGLPIHLVDLVASTPERAIMRALMSIDPDGALQGTLTGRVEGFPGEPKTLQEVTGRSASRRKAHRRTAQTTMEKWGPNYRQNYTHGPTRDVEILTEREPGKTTCHFCGTQDPSEVTFKFQPWHDEVACTRCGGSWGRAIGD